MVTRGLGALLRVGMRVSLLILLAALTPFCVSAQTPSFGFVAVGSSGPETLDAALGTLDWEPGARGALLILDPKVVRRAEVWEEQPTGGRFRRNVSAPTPQKGVYRLNQWEEYFGRRVVNLGTMSVFAPAMMTTLAYRNLPRPDPYAGMADAAKMTLLASGLSQTQWRMLGGPDGIGIGDLSGKQRELFASLLPDPMRVHSYTIDAEGNYASASDGPITLSPQQRLSIRLRAIRKADWTFDTENGGGATIGVGEPQAPGKIILQQISSGDDWEARRKEMFGVQLLPESPNRLKPGDLDFAAPALAPAVSLTDAKTIGDLVTRAAEATGVEIHCDVRYADLPVYLRGDAARAGDVLKAICYAVFGTFRKVGPAFILTDDKVGLGTRHLILGEWAARNRILGEHGVKEIRQATTRANPAQYIGWDGGDPETLDAGLKSKIENYLRAANAPLSETERETGQAERALRVPVAELPAWAQERVKRQVASVTEQNERFPEQAEHFRLKSDHVKMDVRTQLRLVIPGLGEMEAQMNGVTGGQETDLIHMARPKRDVGPDDTAPPEVAAAKDVKIPASASRALLVRPETKDDIEKAAAAAKARGLNELWADVPPGAPELVEAAVAAGKANGLKVVAVIRVLRPGKSVAGTPDVNLMGQTSTARAESAPLWSSPWKPWSMDWDKDADRTRRRALGDYLRPDLPATRDALRPLLIRIAKIPGLSGLVLRDYQPPGYDKTAIPQAGSMEVTDTEALGYNEEMRLAFLRRYQVDPIDLSPLPGGKLGGWNAPGGREYVFTEFALPYFPDFGPDGVNWNVNGAAGTTIGARDRWVLWNQFRVETADAFLHQLGAELKAAAPEIALLRMVGPDEPQQEAARYVSPLPTDPKPAAKETTKATKGGDASKKADAAPPAADVPLSPVDRARRDGKPALACLAYYRLQDSDRRRAFAQQMRLQANLTGEWSQWDGIVLDLSSVPVAAALPLLDIVIVEPKASKP